MGFSVTQSLLVFGQQTAGLAHKSEQRDDEPLLVVWRSLVGGLRLLLVLRKRQRHVAPSADASDVSIASAIFSLERAGKASRSMMPVKQVTRARVSSSSCATNRPNRQRPR